LVLGVARQHVSTCVAHANSFERMQLSILNPANENNNFLQLALKKIKNNVVDSRVLKFDHAL
jgi:hypothetical protein